MTPAEVVEAVFPDRQCDPVPSWYCCAKTPDYATHLPGMAVRCFHRPSSGLSASGDPS